MVVEQRILKITFFWIFFWTLSTATAYCRWLVCWIFRFVVQLSYIIHHNERLLLFLWERTWVESNENDRDSTDHSSYKTLNIIWCYFMRRKLMWTSIFSSIFADDVAFQNDLKVFPYDDLQSSIVCYFFVNIGDDHRRNYIVQQIMNKLTIIN